MIWNHFERQRQHCRALRKASIEEKSSLLKDRASSCRHSNQRCEQLSRFLSKAPKERVYRSQRNDKVRDRVADRVDQLHRSRHRLAHAAITHVFPINVLRHEGLLAASVMTHAPPSHLEAALADATAMTYNAGKWKVDNGSAVAKVPNNIAASVSSILIGYCRFTDRVTSNPDCVAGLAYTAQFIRLLAAVFDVVLPFRVTYAEICHVAGPSSGLCTVQNTPKPTMSPALVGLYGAIPDTPVPDVIHPSAINATPSAESSSQRKRLLELSDKLHANLAFLACALASSKVEANSIRVSSPVHSICVLLSFLNTFPASCKSLLLASNVFGASYNQRIAGAADVVAQQPIIINSTLQLDLDSLRDLESSAPDFVGFSDLELNEGSPFGHMEGNSPLLEDPQMGQDPQWETVENDSVPEYVPPATAVPRLTNSVSTFLRNLADLHLE